MTVNSPSVLWAGRKILNTEFTESIPTGSGQALDAERKEAAETNPRYPRDQTLASRPRRTLIDCGGEVQGESRGNRRKNELFVCALARNRAGFRTPRCPVFGRKGHTPKCWARCCKLQTDLGLAATHRTEVRHVALLSLFRLVVPHVHYGSASETSGKQDQGPVGIYGQSFGEFLKVLTGSVLAADADGDLH